MEFTEYYSSDYATARERFVQAATGLGAALQSHPFQSRGPNDEPLAMDVAKFGDPHAQRVVIFSCGLHGVEGFFGSAIQLAWLKSRGANWAPPSDTAVVVVHAMNPFGFAWRRRWNENNVDLNRNFLDHQTFLEASKKFASGFGQLSPFLHPASPPSRWEPYAIKAILHVLLAGYRARSRGQQQGKRLAPLRVKAIWDAGVLQLQKSLPVGQFENPQWLFYGGAKAEPTVRLVRECLPVWVEGASDVVHVDFHSGLGNYGECRILLVDEPGSELERRALATFGEATIEAVDGKTSYAARGLMASDLGDHLPSCRYQCMTAEYGTYNGLAVLGALRAENRATFSTSLARLPIAGRSGKSRKHSARPIRVGGRRWSVVGWRSWNVPSAVDRAIGCR